MEEDQFKNAVFWFRSSIRYQGERAEIPDVKTILQKAETRFSGSPLHWAAAAAAVLILGAIPVSYERSREQRRAAEQAREDTALLERINAGISRTVPQSMERLLVLGGPR